MIFVWGFLKVPTTCLRIAKDLAKLRLCAASPEPMLIAYVISNLFSCAGSQMLYFNLDVSGDCGSLFTSTTFSFGSPDDDGDGLYDHKADCMWNITADTNQVVLLHILSLDIKFRDADGICRNDGLEVSNTYLRT